MIEHIVKNNETIYDIMDSYHITIDEIRDYNPHISNFYDLPFGMKLRLPILSKEVNQVLDSSEILVESFYDSIEHKIEFEEKKEEIEEKSISKNEDNSSDMIDNIKPNNKVILSNRCYPGILPPKNKYGGR